MSPSKEVMNSPAAPDLPEVTDDTDPTEWLQTAEDIVSLESGEGLLKATYNTEKDGPVIASAYADFKVAEACLKR